MMKRLIAILALLLAALPAGAEEAFVLDERYTFAGMSRSYIQGYGPTVSNHVMTLCAPIRSDAAGRITATLAADDESASPFKAPSATAMFAKGEDGVYRVKFEMALDKARQNGDYRATLTLTGADAQGRAMQGAIPLLIRVRDGLPNEDGGALELSDIAADLRVGEDGLLTATLANASKTKEMTRVTLTVTDASGDIVAPGAMPIKIADLKPGEKTAVGIPLSVRGDAAVRLHTLEFVLGYRALAQDAQAKISYTLPVAQDVRLAQGGVQMPSSIVQGDYVSLTLPLMNMGRGELRGVLATMDMPGVAREQSVLVGTIAAGETKQAKMSFQAGGQTLGAAEGTLTVAYEDAYGSAGSMTLPLSLTVEAPPARAANAAGEDADAQTREDSSLLICGLGGGCGALLLALVTQGAILRRRLRRLEEDKL